MIVGGGMVPDTTFTRQEVPRPRPPHVAVMSTPPSWAALRMVQPGSTESTTRSGRMVSEILMRASGYHSRVVPPAAIGDRRSGTQRDTWKLRATGASDALSHSCDSMLD